LKYLRNLLLFISLHKAYEIKFLISIIYCIIWCFIITNYKRHQRQSYFRTNLKVLIKN